MRSLRGKIAAGCVSRSSCVGVSYLLVGMAIAILMGR